MKDKIVNACLDLAARQEWDSVSLLDIARQSGCSAAQLRGVLRHKDDVLPMIFDVIDEKMLQAAIFEGALKDRLFDLFMARFDAMNEHRDGLKSIIAASLKDPSALCRIISQASVTLGWALQAAGCTLYGARLKLAKLALLPVIGHATRTWLSDDSPDMSATMATLDKGLSKIDGFLA